MISIKVNTGKDIQARVDELYEAVKEDTRVWSMSDRRRTRNLKLIHSHRDIKGIIRRVNSTNTEYLEFECKAKGEVVEAIVSGRFVNLVLRYIPSVSEITINRKE